MRKVKITVLKRTFQEDLSKEYAVKGFAPCPMFKEGDEHEFTLHKPDGFCDEAWHSIYPHALMLLHGSSSPLFGGYWTKDKNCSICCCNDGLRPVIFKIEGIDAEE